MPKVFLSPSTQEWNPYAGSENGNEELYMNLIADLPAFQRHHLCPE